MPRTKLDERRMPKHAAVGKLIIGTAAMMDVGTAGISEILDCCNNTAIHRLRNPGELTLDELVRLGRGLHIPIDELRSAIRY